MVRYQYPFPIEWYDASDPFGNTSPPWRSPDRPHRGADFNGGTSGTAGTPIPVIADGTVVYSDWYDELGNVVSVQHPDGAFSGYCHLSARHVSLGQQLSRGAIIGTVGGTRTDTQSYAPHLHLTMAWDSDGTRGGATRFDPIPYIGARLNGTTTPNPTPKKEEIDMLFLINANDTNANPANRYALVGPGFWFVTSTVAVANNLATRFGSTTGSSASVTWAEWDRAFKAAVSSGFVPASGQTSRTV